MNQRFLLVFMIAFSACSSAELGDVNGDVVDYDNLIREPSLYDGSIVTVEGYHYERNGFSMLYRSLPESDAGSNVPEGATFGKGIWVGSSFVRRSPNEYVRIKGKFKSPHWGDELTHGTLYDITKVEVLARSPEGRRPEDGNDQKSN